MRLNDAYIEAVDQGAFISNVLKDIDQTARPQAAAFDIGAYEYMAEVVNNCDTPQVQDLPLFQMNQLSYGGAFRLPSGNDYDNTKNLNYSQGPIAYNADNNSIYIVGHSQQQAIVEFAIPQLVISNEISDLNMAQNQLQSYKQVLDITPDGNPETLDRIGGLYYYNESSPPKLFVNAYNYYDAGGTRTLTTLILNNALNMAQSSTSGYYKFDGGAGHTNGWMSPIPQHWQAALGGKAITGNSSGEPIISRWSVGPSAFSFNPQDFYGANTSNPIPTNKLLDFSLSNPLKEDLCNGALTNKVWTHKSRATYGFIIPNTRTYFTVGYSAGHQSGVCYKTAQVNGCGGCNQEECAGYCTNDPNDKHTYYWLWDVNDLIAVKNGTKASYDTQPYDYGIFEVPFASETPQIGGGSFDKNTGQLYLSLQKADTEQGTYRNPPLILVYNTNQTANEPQCTTKINVGANNIQLQTTYSDYFYEINGNSTGYTIEILNDAQQVYETINGSNLSLLINMNNYNLPVGLCYFSIKSNNNSKVRLQTIIKTE